MDVKSAFLNGYINELVYVEQPPSFEDEKKPNHVYKLKKTLYGLKQAPRAWYERLRDFLLSNGFKIVTPGFKNKNRYTPYVSPGSQITHIATNKGNINRQCLNT